MTRLRRASLAGILPPRAWLERASFGGFVGVALLLVIFSRAELSVVERLVHGVRDTLTPVMGVVARPTDALHDGLGWAGRQFALADENQRLRAQVDQLLAWQSEAIRLEVENASLREVLSAQRQRPVPIVSTARVVADSRSPFVHTRLLDRGINGGVRDGMAAIGAGGLAGRVIDAGQRSARLLLVTDLNSKIPVLVLPSRDPAILTGDNGPSPRLDFLPLTPRVTAGDRVVTSGAAGILPIGLSIGHVVDAGDGAFRVRPTVDWSDLQHVRLIQAQPLAEPGAGRTR